MGETVRARLTATQVIGVDSTFPYGDFASFLTSLSPSRVGLQFIQSQCSSIIDLEVVFEGPDASLLSRTVKETLVRSEVALGFDCLILKDSDQGFKQDWACVEILPDVMCLPSGKEIATPLSLLGVIPDIFKQVHITGSEICYSVQMDRVEPNPKYARMLVPAIAEVRSRNGISNNINEAVHSAFDLARNDGWSAKERICISGDGLSKDVMLVEAALRRYLNREYAFLPEELVRLEWSDTSNEFKGDTLQTAIARLRSSQFLNELFEQIVPSDPLHAALIMSVDQKRASPCESEYGQYVFVSYARVNAGFVNEILKELDAAGVAYWYDSEMEAGSRWDEELENRIRNCAVFIACVSNEYQSSKYCRREIKFADLVEKSILPVAWNEWVWGDGLQMMFQELQVATVKDPDGFNKLTRKLAAVAPQVFRS